MKKSNAENLEILLEERSRRSVVSSESNTSGSGPDIEGEGHQNY